MGDSSQKKISTQQTLIIVALIFVLLILTVSMLLPDSLSWVNEKISYETQQEEQVMALLTPMTSLEVHSVNISYETVVVKATSLLAGDETREVASGLVVVYSGVIENVYDVTNALSILLGVPIHQISFIEV